MDLKEARYILAIAHYKSIGKAAKALFISQPSLSKYLKNLEQQLGSPLFSRLEQGYIPTYMGERYLYYAEQIAAFGQIGGNGAGQGTAGTILPEEPMDGSILPFPSCSEALYCSLL